jgi:hypothetical protein
MIVEAAGVHANGMIFNGTSGTQVVQQIDGAADIPQIGNIGKGIGPITKQGCNQNGQRSVFRSTDPDIPHEFPSALNKDFIHCALFTPVLLKNSSGFRSAKI